MKKPIVPLMTRLPADLHAELKRLADLDDRSLNGLIVRLLRDALALRHEAGSASPEPVLKVRGGSRTL